VIIYEFRKSSLQKIVFETDWYFEQEFLSIRIYHNGGTCLKPAWQPTGKSITIPIEQLESLSIKEQKLILQS